MNSLLKANKRVVSQRAAFLQTASKSFASSPQKNPFEGVRTQMGSSSFYKLPALGDKRLGKYSAKEMTDRDPWSNALIFWVTRLFILIFVFSQRHYHIRLECCSNRLWEIVMSTMSLDKTSKAFLTGLRTLRRTRTFHSSQRELSYRISRKFTTIERHFYSLFFCKRYNSCEIL